jgi:death-on-curing protein
MEGAFKAIIRYLTYEEISNINKKVLQRTSEKNNFTTTLLNESSLKYTIDVVKSKIFNKDIYPDIYDKASVYAYNIIRNHIFIDGNKRTGTIVAFTFLEINGYTISRMIPDTEIVVVTLNLAKAKKTQKEISNWLKNCYTKV